MAAPLSLQDRVDIAELYARYAWSLDTRDVTGFAELFAPDGAIEMPDVGRFEGRSEVLRYGRLLTDDPTYPGRQHWIGQSLLEGDTERCRVRSYGMVTGRSKDGTSALRSLGYYSDQLVKLDGRWMFGERVWRRWEGDVLSRFSESVP
jgi:SnoaL-like protein